VIEAERANWPSAETSWSLGTRSRGHDKPFLARHAWPPSHARGTLTWTAELKQAGIGSVRRREDLLATLTRGNSLSIMDVCSKMARPAAPRNGLNSTNESRGCDLCPGFRAASVSWSEPSRKCRLGSLGFLVGLVWTHGFRLGLGRHHRAISERCQNCIPDLAGGGPSQLETFDPTRRAWMPSAANSSRFAIGPAGTEDSEVFPNLGTGHWNVVPLIPGIE